MHAPGVNGLGIAFDASRGEAATLQKKCSLSDASIVGVSGPVPHASKENTGDTKGKRARKEAAVRADTQVPVRAKQNPAMDPHAAARAAAPTAHAARGPAAPVPPGPVAPLAPAAAARAAGTDTSATRIGAAVAPPPADAPPRPRNGSCVPPDLANAPSIIKYGQSRAKQTWRTEETTWLLSTILEHDSPVWKKVQNNNAKVWDEVIHRLYSIEQ